MKILYIITQADGGGAQKYVLELATRFGGVIAAGAEAEGLFAEAQKAGLQTFKIEHLKRNISPYHDLLAIWEIGQLIDIYKPDIIHLNSSKAGIVGSFASIGKKAKVVFTAHGFVFNEPLSFPVKNFYLALEKIASDYRDFIIAVSEADRRSALKNRLIAETKIATIHNGIADINFLEKAQARHKLNLPSDKFIFGTVANFYKTKGLDILIEAISRLDASLQSRCVFVLIGSGPLERDLKKQIVERKLNNIILLGQVPNSASLLKAFDCFILPSRKEGFAWTILEAMKAGLPIIATDVGGNKEALADAGLLVGPEDVKSLTKALETVLNSSATELDNLGKKSFERSKLFTQDKMFEETLKVYRKLLSE